MKKLLKLAAVFAAFALMFGFASCSDDDDDENNDESGPATVAVTGVTISGDATEVEVGKTITLTAVVAPENATVKTVTWTSSDEKVATVKDGVVTGVAAGEVKITATSAADNTKKAEKTITVKEATNPGTTYSVSLYIPSLETGEYGEAETYNIGTSNTISAADLGTKLKQDKAAILNSFIEVVNKEDGTQYTIDDVELRFCSEKPGEESEPEWLTTISADSPVYVVPMFEAPEPPAPQEGFIEDITTSGSLYEALNPLAVKTALPDGTYGKISVTGATRGNDTSKVVLEVKGTVSFNVSAGAKIVLKAGSTSKANTSTYTLSGAATTETVSVTGTSYDEVTYNATTDGTVTLTTGTDRGVRFTYIAVSYN